MVKRTFFAACLIGAVAFGQAVAAPAANAPPEQKNPSLRSQAPLPAGQAAPVREAQGIGRPLLYWSLAGAAVIAAVILMAQDGDDGTPATSVTTGTAN